MGIKEWVGGVGMIVLFVISILYFMSGFLLANNPTINYGVETGLNQTLTTFTQRANDLQTSANEAKRTLESETPTPVFLFLIVMSAFTIPIKFITFLVGGAFDIVQLEFTSLFGAGGSFGIIFAVVNGLVLIGIVFAILKAIRSGQMER